MLVIKKHFTDFFEVAQDDLDSYGAFNISLLNDLPLFIDPFLLFNSTNPVYQNLHEGIIKYVRFLCDKSAQGLFELRPDNHYLAVVGFDGSVTDWETARWRPLRVLSNLSPGIQLLQWFADSQTLSILNQSNDGLFWRV